VLEQELKAIMEAQAARGLENQGFWTRGMGTVFILIPFCLRSIRRSGEVALAMELRGYGYGPTRTFLHRVAFRGTDLAVTVAIVGLFLAYWAVRLL
jgi:energy-coupling factor transport system permease protein